MSKSRLEQGAEIARIVSMSDVLKVPSFQKTNEPFLSSAKSVKAKTFHLSVAGNAELDSATIQIPVDQAVLKFNASAFNAPLLTRATMRGKAGQLSLVGYCATF